VIINTSWLWTVNGCSTRIILTKPDNNIGGVNSLMTVGNTNYENLPAIFTLSENENIKIGYDQQPEEIFIFLGKFKTG
jgi:hypothetical protein